jgi:DNA-binding beta-propeller fold protein YncE
VGATGVRSVLSSSGVGSGPPFANPRDVDVAPGRFAAVVTDGQLDAVIMVSLSTGLRTTISSSGIGIGPGFIDLHGIAVDSARDRALVVDDVRSELMAVDLASGDRTTISADGVGSGPSLIGPRRIGIDVARNRALVTLGLSRSIMAIDLASGDRTVFSGGAAGSGPAFVNPFDLVVDLFRDRALVADPGASAVFAVDLATGAREIISGPGVGFGPALLAPAAVALHLGGAPLVADSSLDALFEVGAITGDRSILSGVARGIGPQFARPSGIGSGLSASNLVVADRNALYAVARTNGARTLLSGSGAGSGAPFLELADVAVSRATSPCIRALDAALPGLVDVQPITGNRTLISGNGVGSGPDFTRPRALFQFSDVSCPDTIWVLEGPLVAAVDFGTILRVDPATGERTILADATHGTGPILIDPVAMDVDPRPAGPTAIASVLDAGLLAIVLVDLTTGDRSPGMPLPANIRTPTDLVFDLPRDRLLVTVADPPVLLSVGATTTILSDATNGLGPLFGRPEALELVPSATLGALPSTLAAYVVDSARGSVLVVDLETGERLILTK